MNPHTGDGRLAKAKIKRLYLIPILSKALDVIELFEQSHAPATLEDVYQKTHIWFRARAACVSGLRCRAPNCPFQWLWPKA